MSIEPTILRCLQLFCLVLGGLIEGVDLVLGTASRPPWGLGSKYLMGSPWLGRLFRLLTCIYEPKKAWGLMSKKVLCVRP